MNHMRTCLRFSIFAALVLALAGCAAEELAGDQNNASEQRTRPPPPDDEACPATLDCASCTARPSCGWCNGVCRVGTFSGPTGASCGGQPWAWLESQCSGAVAASACATAHDCASCTAMSQCGWCGGACRAGDASGPTDATCNGQTWAWTSDQCTAPSTGPRLWLVFDTRQSTCRQTVEDMFACNIYATNFNDYTASFPDLHDGAGGGERLTIAGSVEFDGSLCATTHCNIGDHASNQRQFECMQNYLTLPLAPGDVILYYAPPNSEWVGCNDHLLELNSMNGPVHVRGGTVLVGSSDATSWCHDTCCLHTHIGLHEVFEAAGNVLADDRCIDAGSLHPTTCGSGTYWEQGVTRYGNLNSCPHPLVTVSSSSPNWVCTLPRAERDEGRCVGDDLVRCGVSLTSQHCTWGCVDSPTPHCLPQNRGFQ